MHIVYVCGFAALCMVRMCVLFSTVHNVYVYCCSTGHNVYMCCCITAHSVYVCFVAALSTVCIVAAMYIVCMSVLLQHWA